MSKKMKIIKGSNRSELYFVNTKGVLGIAYYGENIMDFLKESGFIEQVEILEVHPDILYCANGCKCGIYNKFPISGIRFEEVPKWVYSKDMKKSLISQLTEEERKEFDMYNTPF